MTKNIYSLNNYSLSCKTPEPGDVKRSGSGVKQTSASLILKHSKCQRFAGVQESPRQTATTDKDTSAHSGSSEAAESTPRVKHCCVLAHLGTPPELAGTGACWSQDTKLDGPLLSPRTFTHLSEVSEEPCLQKNSLGGRWCLAGINDCGC